MELQQFDMRNCSKDYVQKRAVVSITSNNRLSFNKKASDILGMRAGKKVLFFQDKKKKDNWYLKISEDENAFELKQNPSHGFHLNSSTLCRLIKHSIGANSYCKFIMSIHEESSFYAIITHSKR